MLNLSDNRVERKEYWDEYASLKKVSDDGKPVRRIRILTISLLCMIAFSFVPWTQNVRVAGKLTTLYPDQRPHSVQNRIPGRIAKWYVREGDFVMAGDTIVRIDEVMDAFFDPEIIDRTQRQISAKEGAAVNYLEKSEALEAQIEALTKSLRNKLDQAQNRFVQSELQVEADSMDVEAGKIDYAIAQQRLERMEELFEKGLKSLTDLETRRITLQETRAKLVSLENRYESSQNELENARIELEAVQNEFDEKLSKARSDRNAALSSFFGAQGDIAKMENQLSNIMVRRDNYFVTAPQSGYVTQAISVGLGENIAAGTRIVSIMPERYDLATEMYVTPVDFPLLRPGNKVRVIFDGWPAIVFSGWPRLSNGTFGGKILAIDNFISPNGKYRVLVVPDPDDYQWPFELRVGSGADGILLLKDVPLWYEIWRQLNGFPPDYYRQLDEAREVSLNTGSSTK
ncbi:MAG: HlyD family efflux transporter periplasmic adaptor subunit [Cryomorphaceae bacterium]|nr:MAG: HlyD family efflux transporter periplasmic adaptor subunit [Cryomorphaceae bacterium]